MNEFLLPIIFFAISLFYASVGFGGGSSYLALLSIVLVDFYEIRTTALVFNLVVVSIGTWQYVKNNVFDWRQFWPFVVFSAPVALLGTQLRLSQKTFFLILGGALLLAAVFMGLQAIKRDEKERHLRWYKRGALGAAIGLLSGVAGIGGGIFLSPTLNLIGWANPRVIAALASVFILFNSVAGLTGLVIAGTFQFDFAFAFPLLFGVVMGGSVGSYLSNSRLNIHFIRILTAILVAYVGVRLVLLHGLGISI